MTNVHYLRTQLKMAIDCITRGLDAIEAEPAAVEERDGFLVEAKPLAAALEKIEQAMSRIATLEMIALDMNVEACMKHGLNPF